MKDLKRAHEACDGSFQHSGQSAYRWIVRGELMLAARQNTDQHCFDKAQQLDSDWLIAAEIALVYLAYGHPSRALGRARRACEKAPDRYYAWLLQARCQQALGFNAQAGQSLQHCLDLCPGQVEARQRLIDIETGAVSSWGRWLRGLLRR
jgi:tetratricopeptide (TPR) repeat protein